MNKYEKKNCFWLRHLVILKIDTKKNLTEREIGKERTRRVEEWSWRDESHENRNRKRISSLYTTVT